MIRVQLGVGFAALLFISYAAVEEQASGLVIRAADDVAIARARQALAIGQSAWAENVERQRGLTKEASGRLQDGPAAVAAALSRQLGGARVFVLDKDKRVLAESGETGSAPPADLPGLEVVRPGTTIVRIVASEKALVVATAGAPDGRFVTTVRSLGGSDLSRWLSGAGEGNLQLGLVSAQGKLQSYTGGDVSAPLDPNGIFAAKDARFRYVRAELSDDSGESLELVGLGRVDGELAEQMAGLIRTVWFGLGLAGLALLLVVVPVVARLRTKERALEGYSPGEASELAVPRERAASEPGEGWTEMALAAVADVPGKLEEEPVTDLSRTLPPPSGGSDDLAASPDPANAGTRPGPELAASLDAYLPPASTPPSGFGGNAAPMGAFESRVPVPDPVTESAQLDPYAHGYTPEFASEIHPYQDPLRNSEITRGQGASPPPPRSVPAPAPPGSGIFAAHGSGFASGYPSPLASAAPITRGPNVRASYPAPGFEDVRPFDLEHYRLVYNEFVDSKRRLGEVVDNVTLEGFTAKLRKSEQQLIDKHGCRAVRFQVLTRNRQVSLRPQLVR